MRYIRLLISNTFYIEISTSSSSNMIIIIKFVIKDDGSGIWLNTYSISGVAIELIIEDNALNV